MSLRALYSSCLCCTFINSLELYETTQPGCSVTVPRTAFLTQRIIDEQLSLGEMAQIRARHHRRLTSTPMGEKPVHIQSKMTDFLKANSASKKEKAGDDCLVIFKLHLGIIEADQSASPSQGRLR